MMKGKKTGPNISVSHVIESFILSLPPVFDILVIFFFFKLLFSTSPTTGAQQEQCSPKPNMANSNSEYTYKAIQKAGSLRHYAASLLQLYYVCRGPLKSSIFIRNVGLYTHKHTHSLQMCVCGGVLWQLNAFQVFLACWGHRQQPLWRAGSLYISRSTSH